MDREKLFKNLNEVLEVCQKAIKRFPFNKSIREMREQVFADLDELERRKGRRR